MEDNSTIIRVFIPVTSLIAKLIFGGKRGKPSIIGQKPRKILSKFWGVPTEGSKKAYIFYPIYPDSRVDRKKERKGFVSLEDKETVKFLEQNLKKLGFDPSKQPVQSVDEEFKPPGDGIIYLYVAQNYILTPTKS